MKHAISHVPAQAEQSVTPGHNPFGVMNPIRTLRRSLALTTNDLATLQALISFLPKNDGKTSRQLTVVFPSNVALIERTNGLDERTVRRCIGRLVDAGLIQRRDSATRKRFPLRYGGVIRDAFGFDLAPLYQREGELQMRAARLKDELEHIRSLRAEALALRAQALNQIHDTDTVSFLEGLRNVLRRATLKAAEITNIIQQIATMISGVTRGAEYAIKTEKTNTETEKLSGGDGQNVRHVEHQKLIIKKEQPRDSRQAHQPRDLKEEEFAWEDLLNIAAFFPDRPTDAQSATRIMIDISIMLGIEMQALLQHVRICGAGKLFKALDELIERTGTGQIRHPASYLEQMLRSPS